MSKPAKTWTIYEGELEPSSMEKTINQIHDKLRILSIINPNVEIIVMEVKK